MYLSIKISRLSNLLLFASKTDKTDLFKSNLQKYLLDEEVSLFFYGKSESKIWKKIEKMIGKENVKEIKKSIISLDQTFAPYWHKTSKNLLLWKQYFQNNQPLFQKTIIELKK